MKANEISVLSGNPSQDIVHSFKNQFDELLKMKERIIEFNKINFQEKNPELLFEKIKGEVEKDCELCFSAEECKGKCVDLHKHHVEFLNLHLDDKRIDYFSYLDTFDKNYLIPLHKKNKDYLQYIENLKTYLIQFFKKSHSLSDLDQLLKDLKEEFEIEWKNQTLKEFDNIFKQITIEENDPLYCFACEKKFLTDISFNSHKTGKKHIKFVNNLARKYNNDMKEAEAQSIKQINPEFKEKCKNIVENEFIIIKFKQLMYEIIQNTLNFLRKKQSKNYNEREEEKEEEIEVDNDSESSEEEKKQAILNPKNLPTGADGKPIPLWLYKLHGLGIEYKCEICGGAIYSGRRAFEKHFQEWRHAYGMKCLKIPNTIHFKDITRIEDALKLHDKIKKDNLNNSFKPDIEEEFEDKEGNLLNRKQYADLLRQGLLT